MHALGSSHPRQNVCLLLPCAFVDYQVEAETMSISPKLTQDLQRVDALVSLRVAFPDPFGIVSPIVSPPALPHFLCLTASLRCPTTALITTLTPVVRPFQTVLRKAIEVDDFTPM